jgi:hypothetical protein
MTNEQLEFFCSSSYERSAEFLKILNTFNRVPEEIQKKQQTRERLRNLVELWDEIDTRPLKKKGGEKKLSQKEKNTLYLLGKNENGEDASETWEITTAFRKVNYLWFDKGISYLRIMICNGLSQKELLRSYTQNPFLLQKSLFEIAKMPFRTVMYQTYKLVDNKLICSGTISKKQRRRIELVALQQDEQQGTRYWTIFGHSGYVALRTLSDEDLVGYSKNGHYASWDSENGQELLRKLKASEIVLWKGDSLGKNPSSPRKKAFRDFTSAITEKLYNTAETGNLDDGLGIMVCNTRSRTGKIAFGRKTSVPRPVEGMKKLFNQVVVLRPASGPVCWLDKEKRIYEMSAGVSRHDFLQGCYKYQGIFICGASAFGYKEGELQGWIRFAIYPENTVHGGVFVIPDKDWDSLSFLFERGLFFTPQAIEHQGLGSGIIPGNNGGFRDTCFGGLEETSPFKSAKRNQACAAAALMLQSPNTDLMREGLIGYNFPSGYIERGAKILKEKLSKIPEKDIDTSVSIMSKTFAYDMGCVCVKYGSHRSHEVKGFLATPYMKKSKTWDWKEIGEFECGDPRDSFPGSILRICPVVNKIPTFTALSPLGGHLKFEGSKIVGSAGKMSDYEIYLNCCKPFNLGLESGGSYILTARNCSDSALTGEKAKKNARTKQLEWRKLKQ